ncbi:MAG: substrate-binding domain-containing protein [Muricomes sp.]
MKKKLLSALLCSAMVLGLLAGCASKGKDEGSSSDAEGSKDAGGKLKIGIAMKTQDGPYFVTLTKAVQEKCAEIGLVEKASDVVVLNADMDVAKQSENFETFISQKYDLIFVDCIDPDNVIADEKAAYDAGIPVINIDSGVNDGQYSVTTVYSNNRQNGRMCGLSYAEFMGDQEIYSIMLSGEKGNVAGTERRQGLICGILESRLGISEDEAWKLTEEADNELLSKGSYTNEEAKFTIAGQGWGNWTVNDILNDANDLVVKTKDKLNTMFGENDQMLFGGMQAADDAGLTGIHYVAAADGAKEAYDYIKGTKTSKSGEYYCTGENSPVQVAITATNIAKEILVDGADPASYDEVTMTEAIAVTKDNVDERYEFGF